MPMKAFLTRILSYTRSDFVVHAYKLMSGSVLAQMIPILVAPLLSRMYTPANYGILGLYMGITGLIAMFGTLQYAHAIVLAKDEEEAQQLIKLCLQILLGFVLFVAFTTLLFHQTIGNYFNSIELSLWLWMAPISILMNGFSNVFGNYATRHQHYSLISMNRIISAVATTFCSLSIGYYSKNPLGLFVGLWVGQIINGLLLMVMTMRKTGIQWQDIVHAKTQSVIQRFINFPKFSLPSDFINNLTNQLPIFMLNTYGSATAVGHYNMGNRILGLPIGFIAQSFSEVFRQRAAQDYRETGSCKAIFLKTLKTLGLLSILPFALLIIWGPEIFAWVLGEKWREAGHYAQIMGVMFFFRFTVSPLTYVYYIANRQKEDFYLHLLFLLIAFMSFQIGYYYFGTTESALYIFSFLYSGIYCIYLLRSFQLSSGTAHKW
jgi:O-antigen/teichoic acid export membrane protein